VLSADFLNQNIAFLRRGRFLKDVFVTMMGGILLNPSLPCVISLFLKQSSQGFAILVSITLSAISNRRALRDVIKIFKEMDECDCSCDGVVRCAGAHEHEGRI
jgi:hypothetical protein